MTKENATTVIQEMPSVFDVDEIIERLLFIEKVEEARKEIADGKSFTHLEVKNILEGWHK